MHTHHEGDARDVRDLLIEKLTRALSPARLEIEDESELHRGHKGASGGGHFRASIVSDAFEGKGLVARHRLVYEAVAAEMKGLVHALALQTLTPGEDAEQQAKDAADEAERRIVTGI